MAQQHDGVSPGHRLAWAGAQPRRGRAPRQVLPGKGTFAERLATTCANASAELTQRGELHGYVINSLRDGADTERARLPVISMTKIDGCHGDLVAPPWYHIRHLAALRGQQGLWGRGAPRPGEDPEAAPWLARVPRLFFRGTTTGGLVRAGTPYERFHRHRLVEAAAGDPRMDVGFSAYLQARQTCLHSLTCWRQRSHAAHARLRTDACATTCTFVRAVARALFKCAPMPPGPMLLAWHCKRSQRPRM